MGRGRCLFRQAIGTVRGRPKLDPNRLVPVIDREKIKTLLGQRGWRIYDLWWHMREEGWDGSPHAVQHITAPSRGNVDARVSTLWYMARAFALGNVEELLTFLPARQRKDRPRGEKEIGDGARKARAAKKAKKRRRLK